MIDIEIKTKICTKCGNELPATPDHFCRQNGNKNGLEAKCKKCRSEYNKKHYIKNKNRHSIVSKIYRDNHKEDKRWRDIYIKYGIIKEEYLAMLELQGGVCAICKQPETRGVDVVGETTYKLAIDHCHKTGKVRGLLCGVCNKAVGVVEKYSESVSNYLNRL